MTEQTAPTAAQLLAQRNELDKQIAVANLNGLKAIQARLKNENVATLAADLETLLPQLAPESTMGTPHHQANCAITTIRGVTQFFDREVERVEALVAAQST